MTREEWVAGSGDETLVCKSERVRDVVNAIDALAREHPESGFLLTLTDLWTETSEADQYQFMADYLAELRSALEEVTHGGA